MNILNVPTGITLLQMQQRVSRLFNDASVQDVWVTAEVASVSLSRGHMYISLLQKDPATGNTLAKADAKLWASNRMRVEAKFYNATGTTLSAGIKVMLRVTATFHERYGYSLIVSDIDPSYTLGDIMRRRAEILARLRAEGILEQNMRLPFDMPVQNIAVISGARAAGYGDFVKQLLLNPYRLRYRVQLFPSLMQGDRAAADVLAALERVAADPTPWDAVVIIRGGGDVGDLSSFEDYALAAAIATFPIPVIVGIGHDRDTTVLDYVARSVKTPTAAAEMLLDRGTAALTQLDTLARDIAATAQLLLGRERERLSRYAGVLPTLPGALLQRAAARLATAAGAVQRAGQRLALERGKVDGYASALAVAAANIIARRRRELEHSERLLAALSPQATLRRGYTITRLEGRAVTSAADLTAGATLTTLFADGTATSTVTTTHTNA